MCAAAVGYHRNVVQAKGQIQDYLAKPKILKDPVSANFNKSMDVALERMTCLANPSDDANQK